MTKRDWLKKSSMTVMLSTTLLMFAEGGQAVQAADSTATQAETVVKITKSLVGKDYQLGANGPTKFDAPGLAAYVYSKVGIQVRDDVSSFFKAGVSVSKSKLQVGDLLFFGSSTSSKTPSYLGIYIGDNKFVYANQGADEVITKGLSKYYKDRLISARRLLGEVPVVSEPSQPSQPTQPSQPSTGSGTNPSNDDGNTVDPTPVTGKGDAVIEAGLKYLGTPYKYSDSRSDKSYMDCSDFTYNAFKDIGIKIPTNSRSQATYVKEHGTPVYKVSDLKKGDLIFMMSYKGYKASDYSGINKSSQRITHVGIYMGDGKILHTYSKESGGVKITNFNNTSWEYRFVMGGRPY